MDEEEATELTTTTKKDGGDETTNNPTDTTPQEEEKSTPQDEPLKDSSSKPPPAAVDEDRDDDDNFASPSSVLSEDTEQTWWQSFRQTVRMDVVQKSWFEFVILVVIIINCVFLALDNPTNDNATLDEVIFITEVVFTVIYVIEIILKWIAFGLWGRHIEHETRKDRTRDQKSSVFSYMVNTVFNGEDYNTDPKDDYVGYFLDGWNVLDFLVVVIGSIVPLILGPSAASIGSIRAIRILRALRTIPRVPKLRTLVMTIIDAIPGLSGSVVLLSFFFIVFGIIGVQLFHGTLQQQCTTMMDLEGNGELTRVPLTYIALDAEYVGLCSRGRDDDNDEGRVYWGGHGVYKKTCNDLAEALGIDTSVYNYECTDGNENPLAGMQNFDNIFYALLQVFQAVTLQDWSGQCYNLARGHGYTTALFFVPLTFLVSFFAINLILAVIVDTYARSIDVVQHEEDYDSTVAEMNELIQKKTSKRSAPVKQQITYETYPRKLRELKGKVKTFEELFREYNQGPVERANRAHELQRKTKLRVDTTRAGGKAEEVKSMHLELQAIAEEVNAESKEEIYNQEDMKEETWEFTERAKEQQKLRKEMIEDMMLNFNKDLAFEVWLLAKPIKDDWLIGKQLEVEPIGSAETGGQPRDTRRFWQKKKPMFIRWLHWVSTSEWFEKSVIFLILVNTIFLAIHWPGMTSELKEGLNICNVIFTVLFTIELVIKLIGLGPERWWFDKFNVFDAVIVIVSVIELALPNAEGGNVGGALLAFRALRVLRVLRLLHQIPGLRTLFTSILNSFEPVVFLVLIIVLFVFMFGVLGVQLFAGTVYPGLRTIDGSDDEDMLSGWLLMTRPWRFDTLWYSMITYLQLLTADGWPSVMEDVVTSNGEAASIAIIIAVIIGLWLFRNMFLAILINRMGNQDNIQLMIDDLLLLAREKQRIFDEKNAIKEFEKDVRQIRKEHLGSRLASKHQELIEEIEASKRITGKSLGFLRPDNGLRKILHAIQASDIFEWTINTLILLNCVFLALNGPHVRKESDFGRVLYILDWIFTIIFFLEMCLKMAALGIYRSPLFSCGDDKEKAAAEKRKRNKKNHNLADIQGGEDVESAEEDQSKIDYAAMPCTNAYFSSWWNRLDALVVLFACIGLGVRDVAFMRGLRAIRPIRIAIRIPQVRVVVKALIASASNVFNAFCFSFFILFVLGIVGLQLFSGQFGRCVYPDSYNPYDVVLRTEAEQALYPAAEWNKDACETLGHDFINPGYNFDNIFVSILTIFKISMFSNWYDELSGGMASNGSAAQDPSAAAAIPYNREFAAAFFVLTVLIAGFFVLNIIISVVVDSFNRIKNEGEANALLTPEQVLWVRKRRFLQRFPLRTGHKPPRAAWRLLFFNFVEKQWFEWFIVGCILVNTVFLMSEHEGQAEYWTQVLFYLEIIFVIIYSVEAILKLIAYGIKGYFSDWWNVFDFVVVVASIAGMAFDSGVAVIRLLRVLRVIRLIKKAPLLRALFVTLGFAIPSLANIGLLLAVIFFIFGIFGVELFGKVVPSDGYGNPILYDSNEGLSPSLNFEYFSNALFVLYRAATNDNWGSILLATGAQGSNCPSSLLQFYEDRGQPYDGAFDYKCGQMWLSVIYFVLFSVFGTFVLINLFIAVILDTYVDNVEFENKLVRLELLEEWKAIWLKKEKKLYKGKIKPRLPIKEFMQTLKESPVLIGQLLDKLNLRLNIEDTDNEIDYENTAEIKRRSTETYGKVDFVGKANSKLDQDVQVTNDHMNAIFKTRRLRILCSYRGSDFSEELVVSYSDALFAIASLLVGPEFRLLPYDNNKQVHISDWWSERLEDAMMNNI
eukprot:CAMPEP_0197073220 /NCGR_PEP_ID=MMETSP1384-20130603/210494_1 /TAXON_ID=29189 /ORGANISM="Ammonia sp." /LENGTH=1825 /DNA_ID=CAMNT_0042512053 /DNA_START=142 /DNA_END=5619 /DNA_ORIENTATION=+